MTIVRKAMYLVLALAVGAAAGAWRFLAKTNPGSIGDGAGRPAAVTLSAVPGPVVTDVLERYERALGHLSEEERQLLHLRIELDFDYEEIAAMTGRPSRDAVRMAVQRALKKLAEEMGHGR